MNKTPLLNSVVWRDGSVVMLDQRLLPNKEKYNTYTQTLQVVEAIKTMVVRGAPAIGIAAAFGVALSAKNLSEKTFLKKNSTQNIQYLLKDCDILAATRPTAVNLFWAINRMKKKIKSDGCNFKELLKEAQAILDEDIDACKTIGNFGVDLISDGATILTHCNAGALATGGWGTALGVIRSAVIAGKKIKVIADETRPFLQGSRLTAWELNKEGIDVTVIADVAAASLMARKMIDVVIVGADRIAANGDVANKIGTYSVALAAHAEQIPFYVAAPWSTIDLNCPNGNAIPIEERPAKEITHILGNQITPSGVPVLNPSFDVTPFRMVTALITEKGIIKPNYKEELQKFSKFNV